MGSFSTSLSGLSGEEQALSVISNDLANLNTPAFKSGTPIFSDLFYQMLGTDGAGDPVQLGVGSQMSSISSPLTQGTVTTTGVPTDVAIQGNGLFILQQNGTQVYTRAGDFSLNDAGNLIASNGGLVMGYAAVNGVINTTQALTPIVISTGQSYPPNATTTMQMDLNLNASDTALAPATGTLTATTGDLPTAGQTVSIGGVTYTFVATAAGLTAPDDVLIGADVPTSLANLSDAINATPADSGVTYAAGTTANPLATATGTTATTLTLSALTSGSAGNSIVTSTTWTGSAFGGSNLASGADSGTYSDSIDVYDSLGNSHVLNFNFTKDSAGKWTYQITIPAADLGESGNPVVVSTGTLQFDSSGNLISPAADIQGITVAGLADGASNMNLTWQLYSSPGNPAITQTAEASATSGKIQDGFSAGTLQSYSIDSTGTINGVLSNGQTVPLDQIALATFPNYDGLTQLGSNEYQGSLASGAASVGVPGSGGRGTLDGGSLEQSNVDIATAFTMLIQAERGYEANAKAITTVDDILQASIALIRS
jgi:flagellar hook protein FlgE